MDSKRWTLLASIWRGTKMQSCLLLAPMTQDLGDSRMFVASVHNVRSYTSQSPNLSEMRFLVGIRVAKSMAYKHVIWESTLNTSVKQIVAFLTMMRGAGATCVVSLSLSWWCWKNPWVLLRNGPGFKIKPFVGFIT